jgi:hypothetical protein
MKLLSFDIGIRNLAFCFLEGNAKKYSINDWGILDLTSPKTCSSCSDKAVCISEDKLYCKGHSKHLKMRPEAVSIAKIKKTPKADLVETMKKYGMGSVEGNKPVLVEMFDRYLSQKYASPYKAKNCQYISMSELAKSLCIELDKKDFKPEVVVIEQQMKSKMIAISMAVCMYYTMKGVQVQFISARHKLTVGGAEAKTRTYKERKADGVDMCKQRLDKKWLEVFTKHSKKDDMSDSFLQGLWFLEQASK